VVIERKRDTSVVHFSCHGIFGDRYLDSGMVLAETETPRNEQILSPADIMREHIENDLVTLSACETARGEIAGSEFLGLARAFLAAGTRSVIATLWPVDGLATRDFMLSFYSVLLAGNAPLLAIADALRAAQIDRLSAGAPAHDFAAFKLVGCPQVLRAERT
jgi:CHAT domain-containing protein